jgi:hypothetical protein
MTARFVRVSKTFASRGSADREDKQARRIAERTQHPDDRGGASVHVK